MNTKALITRINYIDNIENTKKTNLCLFGGELYEYIAIINEQIEKIMSGTKNALIVNIDEIQEILPNNNKLVKDSI